MKNKKWLIEFNKKVEKVIDELVKENSMTEKESCSLMEEVALSQIYSFM